MPKNDIKYIPMVIEASGGSWNFDSEVVWKLIIRNIAHITCDSISNITNNVYQSLSTILAKSNARSILKRSPFSVEEDWTKINASALTSDQ